MYRGGAWSGGAAAGLFSLRGGYARSNSGTHVGFRSALALFVRPAGYGSAGTPRQKGYISRLAKPKINARRQPDNRDDVHTAQTGRSLRQSEGPPGRYGAVAIGSPVTPRIVTRGPIF